MVMAFTQIFDYKNYRQYIFEIIVLSTIIVGDVALVYKYLHI